MRTFATLFFIAFFYTCVAQEVPFKQLRYDENYAYLAKDTTASWYHRLKFAPVNPNKTTYFSFGGEVRYQYFHFDNQDWGEAPQDKDGFILTRYLGHLDFHSGKHFRTFVQLQSSLASGEAEDPSPVDQNLLDLHQAFVEYTGSLAAGKDLTFRFGRQELSYGSQRLVAVREAPNNRQSFDAAKLMYAGKNIKTDVFYSSYVPARPNIFDDRFDRNTRFWGVYGVFNKVPLIRNLDLYYFGLHKKTAVFDDGKGMETRQVIGTRIWETKNQFQYDLEGVYQFGNFAIGDISAWTASANISYTFSKHKLKPQLGLKTEAISGDKRQGDGKLNTFNPLFPKGAYFGLAALIGPYNLLDAHPYLQLNLSPKLIFAADYDIFWRMNDNDGLYAVNGKLIYNSQAGISRKIGSQLGSALEYMPNRYLYLRQEITWFSTGNFLKEAGPGKDILMLGTTVTFKF